MNKILKSKFIIMLIIPFLEPVYLREFSSIHNIYSVSKYVSLFIIFTLYTLYSIHNKVSPVVILISMFQLSFFVSTIINQGSYWIYFLTCGQIIAICLIVEMAVRVDALNLLESLFIILSILVYINFITIILFPTGLFQYSETGATQTWFLGYDNAFAPILFSALCIAMLLSYYTKKRIDIKTIFLLVIVIATYLWTWVGGAMIGMAMIIFFIMFLYNNSCSHIFNFFNYVLLNIVYFIMVIIFRFQNYFSFIIINILHKDLTFTGRTIVWDNAIKWVLHKPIFGNGIEDAYLITVPKLGGNIWYIHAHNDFLDIMYMGGFIGFMLYAALIFIVGKKLIKYKKNQFSNILSFVLFTFFIMMQNEAFRNKQLFCALLVICYHINEIIVQQKTHQLKTIINNHSYLDGLAHKKSFR